MVQTLKGITRDGRSQFRNPRFVSHSPVRMQNLIHFDVVGPDGKIKQSVRNIENIMLTYGLASAGKLLSTSTDAGSKWAQTMAIGTSSTAAASTDAGLNASTQLAGTFSRSDQGNRTARYLATFGSDGNASEIREIGIFASNVATASGICHSVLTGTQSVNRGASDEIRVSYDVLFTTA